MKGKEYYKDFYWTRVVDVQDYKAIVIDVFINKPNRLRGVINNEKDIVFKDIDEAYEWLKEPYVLPERKILLENE